MKKLNLSRIKIITTLALSFYHVSSQSQNVDIGDPARAYSDNKNSSDVIQTCYTDEGVSPQITTFLKKHNEGRGFTLLINYSEEGKPETLRSSGYRPVAIEESTFQNPLFEITLTLTPLSRSGLKSRNFAEGTFTDPAGGNVIHFETELECAIRNPRPRDWIFTNKKF